MKGTKKFLLLILGVVLLAGLAVGGIFIFKTAQYNKAEINMTNGNFDNARSIYLKLGNFKNAKERVAECDYLKAGMLFDIKEFDEAKNLYASIEEYKDAKELVTECDYSKATYLLNVKSFEDAKSVFASIPSYKNAKDMVYECDYEKAVFLMDGKSYEEAKALFSSISDYGNAADMVFECDYQKAEDILYTDATDEAKALFDTISDYKDAAERILQCDYRKAEIALQKGDEVTARDLFLSVRDYDDALRKAKDITIPRGLALFDEKKYESAKEEFAIIEDDADMDYYCKSCDMEIVRNLCLSHRYNDAGAILVTIIDDEEFMSKYYGADKVLVNDEFHFRKPGEWESRNCTAKQYCKNGGAEVGKVYFTDMVQYECFYYRVTKNGEYIEFADFYPNGKCYEHY